MSKFKLKIFCIILVCIIVGFALGSAGHIFFTLPASYKIPDKVQSENTITAAAPNVEVINSSDISLHFIELGNKYTGDCIYIKVGNTDILVDAGSKASSIPYITDYVDRYVTDKKLDYVIITHAHEDHYAGFATNASTESLFDHYSKNGYSVGNVLTFSQTKKSSSNTMHKNYERELAEVIASGATHLTALECWEESINPQGVQGQRFFELGKDNSGDSINLQILYTKFYESKNKSEADSENEFSVCFQIVQGTKYYLFTGDLEKDGEESLAESNDLKPVEVYKAGHHGSKTSSTATLMSKIQPKIVVVCCCAGSSQYTSKKENQFPTQAFINNVSIYTSKIYVTTLCIDYSTNSFESFNGTITICSTGNQTTQVMCSNNTTVLKDTEWFKANRTLPPNAVA